MVQIIQAQEVNLRYLIDKFKLERVQNQVEFFPEWQNNFPELSSTEKQWLDRVQQGFLNLLNYPPVSENLVKMAVVDPILFIAGFFLYPYYIRSEASVELILEDEDTAIKGRMDTLVLKEELWVMVIESKKVGFSTDAGLAQILTYMLNNPHPEHPSYGMIATGGTFIFVKLVQEDIPQYAT
ncbi:MAG: restriction endonuclease subunit R, partial [Cyanobacteria bacterium J06592_8]